MRDMMIMLLAIGMMSPALAAEAPQSGIAGLTAFADAFDAAQIAQDRAALDRMVADDLVFIDGSCKRYGKAFFIHGWTGPDDHSDPVTLQDRPVLPHRQDPSVPSAQHTTVGPPDGYPPP